MQNIKRTISAVLYIPLIVSLTLTICANAQSNIPSDEEIRNVLRDKIDNKHESVGMVVGIITPDGSHIIPYGHISNNDSTTINGNTIFELGSVTKIFTAMLLADMVKDNEVSLNDPIEKFLPAGVKTPERNGKKITLIDLATQTSGLPFWPDGIPLDEFGLAMMTNYKARDLYKFLSGYSLPENVGEKWEYSNLGFGLLGHVLTLRAQKDFDALLKERITGKLNMASTFCSLPPELASRLCVGYNDYLHQAPYWDIPLLPGCASLKSSANDLLIFVGACMGITTPVLDSAMAIMLKVHRSGPQLTQALGWWITFEENDNYIITHPGQTLGFSSIIAIDPMRKTGVVVLSNSTGGDVLSIAWHILRPKLWPWTVKAPAHKAVIVEDTLLSQYAGEYFTSDSTRITIVKDTAGLILKTPATPPEGIPVIAESDRAFFAKGIDLQVTFTFAASGQIEGLVIKFGDTQYVASRIKSKAPGK